MSRKALILTLIFVGFPLLIHVGAIPFDTRLAVSGYLIRGDANGDGAINGGDIVYLIFYLFRGGPAPPSLEHGDANGDGVIGPGDVVYLINYLFLSGPPPPPLK